MNSFPSNRVEFMDLLKVLRKWIKGNWGPPANLWTYSAMAGKLSLHLMSPCLALVMASFNLRPALK